MGYQKDIIWTASVLLTGASMTLIWRLVSNVIKTQKIERQMKKQSEEMAQNLLMKFLQEKEDDYE